MLTRDQRRFKNADRDGDGIATREEFTAFLHPEEFDYMKDIVIQVRKLMGRMIQDKIRYMLKESNWQTNLKSAFSIIFLQETIEDIDKNGDMKIDLQEYIGKYTDMILWLNNINVDNSVNFTSRGHVYLWQWREWTRLGHNRKETLFRVQRC